MRELRYTITDEMGLHARPAGQLAKLCSEFECDIRLGRPGGMASAKGIMGLMRLAMKQGEEMAVTFDGADEDAAADAVGAFLAQNL